MYSNFFHSCKPLVGLNIMHALTSFRSTQHCSSIACFRQPVAGINQNPSMHAFTAAHVFSYTRNRAVTESGESSQPCADMYVHAVLRHIGPYMHIVSSCTKRLGALLNFISSAGNGGSAIDVVGCLRVYSSLLYTFSVPLGKVPFLPLLPLPAAAATPNAANILQA